MVLRIQGFVQWVILVSVFVGACGIIYAQVIRKLILGVQYLIDIGEFLQKEMQGKGADTLRGSVNTLTDTVAGMDEAWSKHLAEHSKEHTDIWIALTALGYNKRKGEATG